MSNDRLAGYLSMAGRALSSRVASELAAYDISRGEYRLLFALYHEEGVSQTALSERHHLDKGVVTRVITRLEEKGFVERRPDPDDARRNRLYLTARSEALRADVEAVKQRVDDEVTAGMSDAEVDALVAGLTKVLENLDAEPGCEDREVAQ